MKYESAIGEIENMRSKLSRLLPDSETLSILKRYYAQLCLMKNRFPMEKGDTINVAFSWMDKNSDTSNAVVFEDINYELACVMYNIGAVHAAIAANEARTDLDSIKNAFTHFQCAAYPFEQIRDSMNAMKYSAVDFDPSILTFYTTMLLAQAQECLLEKSVIDHRKNTVIAKLAIHLRDVYMQCREHFDFSGLNDILSSKCKEWLRTCTVKSEIYGAIAMLHLGLQAEEDNKMGFRVSYFDFALEYVSAAMKQVEKDKRESLKEAVIFLNDVILGKQRNAKKENDFIYHDRIPKSEELAIIEGVNMVKAVGFDPTDKSISGPDLFAALLPGNVLKSLSIYSEEKAKFKRTLLEEIEEKDKELEDYIKSLQLEEINFNDGSKVEELPEMLLERSAAFNSQPDAFPELLDKLHRVGDCAIEADHKICNLRNRLDAINSLQLRADEGFSAIMKELNRVNDHHMKARTNNAELQRALAAHSESLKILAMPLNELRKRLTDNTEIKPADSTEGLLLKKMLDKANEMSTQRRNLLSKLNEDLLNDDITAKCLAEKNEDNWGLYENELKKHEETATLIRMNLAAQNNILAALTDANASFGDYRKKIMNENKNRMDQVLALTAAYDVYIDVSQKTEEGLKFYSTLFSMIKGLGDAVEAIETAFEEEKKEKEKEMLKGLEERATGMKWTTTSAQNIKKDADYNSTSTITGSENVSNDNKLEMGFKGLRLKDCLEYYRSNIAKGTHGIQQSQPVDILSSISHKDELQSNQTMPTSDTAHYSQYQSSASLRSQFASMSNPSIPNTSLSSAAKMIPQPYIFSDNIALSQASKPLLNSQSQTMVSLTPQYTVTSPYHFSGDQRTTSTIQNRNAINATLTVANPQQINTSILPPISVTHGISQPISSAVTTNLVKGSSMTALRNDSSTTLSTSTALNYTPNISCASNPALLEKPALIKRSDVALNTIAPVKIEKPIDRSAYHSQVYASPFASNKLNSTFARNMIPTAAVSTLVKPEIFPAHNFIYPQDATFHTGISPWHQPLRNINDLNGLAVVESTKVVSVSPPTTSLQSFIPNNQAAPVRSTAVMDIMNTPLDVMLPAPLVPTHLISEVESSDSNIQMVHPVPSIEPTKGIEEINLVQTPQLSESGGSTPCSIVVQTPRPAAAVAPIMQTDCNTTSAYDSTLSITNVTSMSYSAPLPQPKTMPSHISSCTKNGNGADNECSGTNSSVKEVMNPQTFTIGNTDPVRLEKRYMREQFRTEGIDAQLPPLDPTDPINCIDAHYWLNKS
ncbi:hypothetical protein WUBG_03985 [Wuchereria bancrofti]|uniref:BRO1 domain-containing protein n=1 Tax=Wuchereria bancrofti TaxID=6293 RepID=J9BD69_WUCBA|nr:hypothetical protein WUBG_03985 [Wuchereria bancrofti]